MKTFTKNSINALRTEIDNTLAALGKKHGISLEAGNCTFNASTCTFKLKCGVANSDGSFETKESLVWKEVHKVYGFTADDAKRPITRAGRAYMIVGFNTAAKKYPLILEDMSDGMQYKFSIMQVKDMINHNKRATV
jgi:hypothetical protein